MKFLVSIMLCVCIVISARPMERKRPSCDTDNQEQALQRQYVGIDNDCFDIWTLLLELPELFVVVAYFCDGKSFSALTQVCSAFKKASDEIPIESLVFITPTDAMNHSNANLARRYLAEYNSDASLFTPLALQGVVLTDVIDRNECEQISILLGRLRVDKQRIYKIWNNQDYLGDSDEHVISIKIFTQDSNNFPYGFVLHTKLSQLTRGISGRCVYCNFSEHLPDIIVKFFERCSELVSFTSSQAIKDLGKICFDHLCFNIIFMFAAKKNHVAFVQVLLASPIVLDCLSCDVLRHTVDLTTDTEIKQMINEVNAKQLIRAVA